MEDLVSIVIPTYNCADFITATLESILKQTHSNYEALIIDDCSTDDSYEVIKPFLEDERFIYHKLLTNSGAAIARNKGVELSKGDFIAFLDSDDLWIENKLEKQLIFMKENAYHFTSTTYGRIDNDGNKIEWESKFIKKRNYNKLLRRSPGNSTVMYNAKELGKTFIPDIKKRNDYVMWLKIIKKAKYIYEIDDVLMYYRIREGSLSRKKCSLIKYHWFVYRKIEKLSILKSSYLISWFVLKGVLKFK